MTTDDKVRSLTRDEIKVLYWKCKGYQYKQIALRYDRSVKWVEGLMTRVYDRLEVNELSTATALMEYLKKEVCDIVQQIIGENEENLERWPLYGMTVLQQKDGTVIYVEKDKPDPEKPPDPLIIALVIYDQGAEDREAERRKKEQRIRDILRLKEEARKREEERKKFEEEEKRKEEERRKKQEEPVIVEEPKRLPGRTRTGRWGFWISMVLGLSFVLCGVFLLVLITNIGSQPSASSTAELSPTTKETSILADTSTPEITSTLVNSPTPSSTPTPAISPTPVPLPIREDFSHEYSDLWWTTGNPFVTERVDWGTYSGVLTTDPGATATMFIGNTAWTDYIVSLRAGFPRNDNKLLIGVRAQDPNNMIGLECNGIICSWIIVKDGRYDNLPATSEMHIGIFTLTVEGNTFIAVDNISSNRPNTMSLVLPPKYEGLFQGGGVLLQVTSAMEVDFIEINPLP